MDSSRSSGSNNVKSSKIAVQHAAVINGKKFTENIDFLVTSKKSDDGGQDKMTTLKGHVRSIDDICHSKAIETSNGVHGTIKEEGEAFRKVSWSDDGQTFTLEKLTMDDYAAFEKEWAENWKVELKIVDNTDEDLN